ncbi:unnamed protein product, partial [Musa hybrid cultivar]
MLGGTPLEPSLINFKLLSPIKESALGNIRTIAFCNTDSLMRYVDIGIPANNKGKPHIGCLFWLLTRMGLQMRGTIAPGHKWEVMLWGTLKRPKSRKRLKLLWHLNMVLLLSTLVWYQLISGLPSNGHLIWEVCLLFQQHLVLTGPLVKQALWLLTVGMQQLLGLRLYLQSYSQDPSWLPRWSQIMLDPQGVKKVNGGLPLILMMEIILFQTKKKFLD